MVWPWLLQLPTRPPMMLLAQLPADPLSAGTRPGSAAAVGASQPACHAASVPLCCCQGCHQTPPLTPAQAACCPCCATSCLTVAAEMSRQRPARCAGALHQAEHMTCAVPAHRQSRLPVPALFSALAGRAVQQLLPSGRPCVSPPLSVHTSAGG
jgi:hypothetical protein